MVSSSAIPDPTLKSGDELHGFIVEEVTPVPDVRALAYRLTHKKSGARLLHLHANDPENLFAIGLRTPPYDHTGLPHILEHTVLCGSQRYPVKDPFVELLKTSMASFLNAMTYPDKTVYPVASMNHKDYFNLAGVYCDAVFFPLLTKEHFQQEGHHFDFAEPGNVESDLIVKGIVYNEMKGAYSDLDGVIGREESKSICPDNAYGFDSGGDPERIPDLTYEKFVQFHKEYYHPSNSLIFIFGDITTTEHLAFLDKEYLSRFERIEINTGIDLQPRWSEPRRATIPYPLGKSEDPARKTAVTVNFLTNDITESIKSLGMSVIEYYLLGNAASPLRKALLDSKLGEALTGSGYADYQRDTFFTAGLKGTEAEHAATIEKLILATCRSVVTEGMDADKIETAFHKLEISSREIKSMYPLRLMGQVYNSWLYDADPLHHLHLDKHLAELRRRYETEERFFENLLQELVTDNPHYTVLSFVPDKECQQRQDATFAQKMQQVKAEKSVEELAAIATSAAALDAMQSQPNPPEALATLPRLSLADVPPEPLELSTSTEQVSGQPFLTTDIFTGGISYAQLAFDLRGLDDNLLDYLPLYTLALRRMGAGDADYLVMAEREAAVCGGLGIGVSANGRVGDPHFVQPFLTISTSALDRNVPQMLDIVRQRLTGCDLTDLVRLKEIILESRQHRRGGIIPSGNQYAASYAARHLSRNQAISERFGGFTQVRLFDWLADNFDAEQNAIVEKLTKIRESLLSRERLTASVVGDAEQVKIMQDWYGDFLAQMGTGELPEDSAEITPTVGTFEGVAMPSDGAYVAKTFSTVAADHPDATALLLLSLQLSYGFLWNEVRVKGGAYGARAGFDPLNGNFTFGSYRDPNIRKTLTAFAGSFAYIKNEMDLSAENVEQAIIGALKTLDRPIRPGAAVGMALFRHLTGETVAFRKEFRQRLLSLTSEQITRVATEIMAPAFKQATTAVLSSREKITAANAEAGESQFVIEDL